jgi:hypothetical protein
MAKTTDNMGQSTQGNNPIKTAINAQANAKNAKNSTNANVSRDQVNPIQAIDAALNKAAKKPTVTPANSEDIKSLKAMLAEYINYTKTNDINQNKTLTNLISKLTELISLNKSKTTTNKETKTDSKDELKKLDKPSFENFQRTFKNNDIHEIRDVLVKLNKNIETYNKSVTGTVTNNNKSQDLNIQIDNEITTKHFEDIKAILNDLSSKIANSSSTDIKREDIEKLVEAAKRNSKS